MVKTEKKLFLPACSSLPPNLLISLSFSETFFKTVVTCFATYKDFSLFFPFFLATLVLLNIIEEENELEFWGVPVFSLAENL